MRDSLVVKGNHQWMGKNYDERKIPELSGIKK